MAVSCGTELSFSAILHMLPRNSGRRGRPSRNQLRLESLEDRHLMSITPGDPDPHPHPEPVTVPNVVSMPSQQRHFNYDGFLTAPSNQTPIAIAEQYLRTNAGNLGMLASDVNNYLVTRNYVTQETGATSLTFQQTLNGLPVRNANFNITVMPNGQLLSVMGGFVSGLSTRANQFTTVPSVSAQSSLNAASAYLKLTNGALSGVQSETINGKLTLTAPSISKDKIVPTLEYVSTGGNGVALAWNLRLRTLDGQNWYTASVDALSGKMVSLGNYFSHASYEAIAVPGTDPEDTPRTIITDPHIFNPVPATVPSPFGWHDTDGVAGHEFTTTKGNNVNAYADRDADDLPDAGSQPDGGANLDFTGNLVGVDFAQAPSTYTAAAVTNLFYWNNILHDVHYLYGFDEAAGNFQFNNYGRGGAGGDAVNAEAQDGSGINNANFGTPPDGEVPIMQMFEFNVTTPSRDGDFANDIIIHEYGHGVSNRLTGNAEGLFALQSGGMGEGWSDFWALMLTQQSADEPTVGRGTGMYVLGEPQNGAGVRDFKYGFDITDPELETFRSFNNGVTEVHASGTRWTAVLWDINKLLIDKYGFEPNVYNVDSNAGNIQTLKLVMNALKIQPTNPSFIDARDAILLADQMLFNGANNLDIWEAFARRGLGLGASTASGNAPTITLSFEVPRVAPVAIDDTASLLVTSSTVINVLANDFDPNYGGEILPGTVKIVTPPTGGVVFVNPVTGLVTYTPAGAIKSTDFFEYTVTNNFGLVSNAAKVTVTVNLGPSAADDIYNTAVGVPVNAEVLLNDYEPNAPTDSIKVDSLAIVTGPANGTAVVNPNGTITYTPNPGFEGGDTLTYRVASTDDQVSNLATVTFRVGNLHSLGGRVFVDLNNNGLMDGNDWALAGVSIFIEKTNGAYKFKDLYVTDKDGFYTFTDLVTGTYNVRQQHPGFFIDGIDSAGTPAPVEILNDEFRGISLSGGIGGSGFNFAEKGLNSAFAAAYLNRTAYFGNSEGTSLQNMNLGKGDAWVAFDGGVQGELFASTFLAGSGTATLTLYDQNLNQIAKSSGSSGALNYKANSSQPVFLKVSGSATNVSLSAYIAPLPAAPTPSGPRRNNTQPFDVNGDGRVAPSDILALVDFLNQTARGESVASYLQSSNYFDVNGDGNVSPADILGVVDHLNAQSRQIVSQGLLSHMDEFGEDKEFASASSKDFDGDNMGPLAVDLVMSELKGV
jgi:extracellular elastinolytic metalloproteinase